MAQGPHVNRTVRTGNAEAPGETDALIRQDVSRVQRLSQHKGQAEWIISHTGQMSHFSCFFPARFHWSAVLASTGSGPANPTVTRCCPEPCPCFRMAEAAGLPEGSVARFDSPHRRLGALQTPPWQAGPLSPAPGVGVCPSALSLG